MGKDDGWEYEERVFAFSKGFDGEVVASWIMGRLGEGGMWVYLVYMWERLLETT